MLCECDGFAVTLQSQQQRSVMGLQQSSFGRKTEGAPIVSGSAFGLTVLLLEFTSNVISDGRNQRVAFRFHGAEFFLIDLAVVNNAAVQVVRDPRSLGRKCGDVAEQDLVIIMVSQ